MKYISNNVPSSILLTPISNIDTSITKEDVRNVIRFGEGLKKLFGCLWTARRQDGLNGMYSMLT